MFKKIIKRLILMLLVTALIAPEYVTTANSSFDGNISLLHDLGIISEKNTNKDNLVTRAEFISAAANIYWDEIMTFTENSYKDLNVKNPYYDDIMAATTAGLIVGNDESKILPDTVITPNEVSIILLRLLGYKLDLRPEVTFENYEILKGKTRMSWENVAEVLVDILDKKVVTSRVGGSEINYSVSDKTVLEHYRSIYKFDGIMSGAYKTHINIDMRIPENQAIIGGETYVVSGFDAYEYIGYRVKGYYHYNERDVEKTILTIEKYRNTTLFLEAEDVENYHDKTLYYSSGKSDKTAKMSANLDVIYNFQCDTSFQASDMMIKNGSLEFIDNDNDGKYDIAKIKTYKTYIVESIDTIKNVIYLKYSVGNQMEADFNADKDIELKNSFGYDVDLRELKQGDVICAYESRDESYIRAIHSINEFSGEITIMGQEGGETYLVIDDKQYFIADICEQNQGEQLKVGTSALYTLDLEGKITYISGYEIISRYSYVVDIYMDKTIDKTIYMKLMLDDGSFHVYPIRKKVKLNSEDYKTSEDLWQAIDGTSFRHQLIRCKVSSDGEVFEIETAEGIKDGGFEMFYTDYDYSTGQPVQKSDSLKHYYKSNSKVIATKVSINSDTLVMIIPNSPEETDEKYYKLDMNYLKHDTEYRIEAYRSGEDGYIADAIIIYDDVSADYAVSDQNTSITVFDSLSIALNEDNEIVYGVKAYENGALQSYMTRDTDIWEQVYGTITPKRGDLLRYELKNGIINKLELIYSVEKGEMIAPTSVTNADNNNHYLQFRVWDAYVFYRFGGYMLLSKTMPTDYETYNYADFNLHYCAGSSIVIYDSEDDRIYPGTADDLVGYKNTKGTNFSKVIVQERYGEGKTIVIYK